MRRRILALLSALALITGFAFAVPAGAAPLFAASESGGYVGTLGDLDPLTSQGATGAPDYDPVAYDGTYTQLYTPNTTMTATFASACFVGPGADVKVYDAGSLSGTALSVAGVAATNLGDGAYTSSNGGGGFARSFDVTNVVSFLSVGIAASDAAPADYAEIDAVECLHPTNPDMVQASGGLWNDLTTYGGRTGKLVYALGGAVADDGANGAGSLSINYKLPGVLPVTCVFTPDTDSSASFVDGNFDGYTSPTDGDSVADSFYLQSWTMTCGNGATTTDAYLMLFGADNYAAAPRGAVRVLPSLTQCGAFNTNDVCTGPFASFEIGTFGVGWPLDTGNVTVAPAA